MIQKTTIIKTNPKVAFKKIGPSTLITYQGEVYELNKTALDIWRSIDGKRTMDDLIRVIAEKYAVDPENVKGDIHEWITYLNQMGILEVA